MKTFWHIFFGALLLALLLLPFIKTANAQTPSQGSTPTYLVNGYDVGQNPDLWANPDLDKVTLDNGKPGLRIDGTVRTVLITFKNLDDKDYYICGRSDPADCIITPQYFHKFTAKSGEINMQVCGAGKESLKGHEVDSGGNITGGSLNADNGCNKNKDYFFEGNAYKLNLFQDKNGEAGLFSAEFFVRHSFPLVKISSAKGGNLSYSIPVMISLWGRRPGGDNKNNYQVIIEGINNNYKREHCFTNKEGSGETVGIDTQGIDRTEQTIKAEHFLNGNGWFVEARPSSTAESHKFGRGDGENAGIGLGSFLLKINERVSDNRPLGIGNNCEGGYSYLYIYFRFDPKKPGGIDVFNVAYDPNNSGREDLSEEAYGGRFAAPPPPCKPGAYDKTAEKCTAIDSAIGTINTTPQGFIASIFAFILTIAGFGAIIIIIYSGYILITSRGNKERVAAARETLTSAIVGLLFIIFSIVILEIIGVDILRIPGLGR